MKNRNLNHKDHWQTPPEFLALLSGEFDFNFDPCPYQHNVDLWDGLKIDWQERNFINPPYSDQKATGYLISSIVQKAIEESRKGKLCVCLLPVSISTKLFHNFIQPNATEIRFLFRRIKFIGIPELKYFLLSFRRFFAFIVLVGIICKLVVDTIELKNKLSTQILEIHYSKRVKNKI